MIGTPINIKGKEFLVRYPIGALVRLEKALGWSIIDIKKRTLTIEDMTMIVRYGLHNENGTIISQSDYDELLDSVNMEEFADIFTTVSNSFGTSSVEGKESKN